MKILSLGANGAVGQLAIDDLLNANHEVTALVRNGSSMNRKHPQLTVVQGEPTNAADLEKVLAQQDVVRVQVGVADAEVMEPPDTASDQDPGQDR